MDCAGVGRGASRPSLPADRVDDRLKLVDRFGQARRRLSTGSPTDLDEDGDAIHSEDHEPAKPTRPKPRPPHGSRWMGPVGCRAGARLDVDLSCRRHQRAPGFRLVTVIPGQAAIDAARSGRGWSICRGLDRRAGRNRMMLMLIGWSWPNSCPPRSGRLHRRLRDSGRGQKSMPDLRSMVSSRAGRACSCRCPGNRASAIGAGP